jgi:hypothetical protein
MFSRNRYDAAKILLALEAATVEQMIEYHSREEALSGRLSDDEIAQLPKERMMTLTVDYPGYEDEYEIDLCFRSEMEGSDEDFKNLAADVLKDIALIDNQHQEDAETRATRSPFGAEAYAANISDFVFRSYEDIQVGYVGSCVNTEFDLPLKKEHGTWQIDWERYQAIIEQRRQDWERRRTS